MHYHFGAFRMDFKKTMRIHDIMKTWTIS